jgi:hypothetical protein
MPTIHGPNVYIGKSAMIFSQGRAKISSCGRRINAKDKTASFSPAPGLKSRECDLGVIYYAPRCVEELPSGGGRTCPAVRSLKKDGPECELEGA